MAGAGAASPAIRYIDENGAAAPLPRLEAEPPRRRRLPLTGRLHWVRGTAGSEIVDLSPSRPLTIGRDDGNDVQLLDGRVSRRHGRIEYSEGQYVIVDLQSANGIIVNGRRIDPDPDRLALHDGDVIEIGTMGVVAFRVELSRLS
jgi:predicted component of type VI protein secretion system